MIKYSLYYIIISYLYTGYLGAKNTPTDKTLSTEEGSVLRPEIKNILSDLPKKEKGVQKFMITKEDVSGSREEDLNTQKDGKKTNLTDELSILDSKFKDFIKNVPKEEKEIIKYVNSYVNNKIDYQSDESQFGQKDKWQSVYDTFMNKNGDCEDFAIAKYFILKELGVPISKLRLTYGKLKNNGAHMVLIYLPHGKINQGYLLDNISSELKTIKKRKDFTRIYSFNHQGYYGHTNKSSKASVKLSKFDELKYEHNNSHLLIKYLKEVPLSALDIDEVFEFPKEKCREGVDP